MKDVLALLTPTPGNGPPAAARYAFGLARGHEARVSVYIADIDASADVPSVPDDANAGGGRSGPSTATGRRERTAELALSAAEAADVRCEILPAEGEFASLREAVIYLAQVRDIVIVDVHGPLRPPRRYLVEDALFGSGRPLVLVPQDRPDFAADTVVVAWDATRSATRAVHDALPVLRRARDVIVVSVIDDKTFWKPETGAALCRHLTRWDVAARFEGIRRDDRAVGETLLDHARRAEADLLVMGAFAHGIERELMLGSATRDVFDASLALPVLLSH